MYIGKCSNPLTLVNASVIVEGYEDQSLEGENIMFSCPSGLVMIGPNTATCIGNGEWEPDPREVNCIGTYIYNACQHLHSVIIFNS